MTTALTWSWSRGSRVALYNAIVELEGIVDGAVLTGTGSPEGAVTAVVGTVYVDTAGTSGVWTWVKATGTGNTGWQGVSPAVGWDDLRVSLAMSKLGSSAPVMSTFQSPTQAYKFAKGDFVLFDVQLPHTWMVGTNLEPHIHWAPSTTNTGTVEWALSYTWANYDDAFPAATVMDTVSQAASGTAYDHQIADLGTITGTGKKASSVLMCHLQRINGGTFTGDVFGLSVDFHYQTFGNGGLTEFAGAT